MLSSSPSPMSGLTWFTDGVPMVQVPVLSRTMTSVFEDDSTAVAVLNSIPYSEPFQVPTTMARGVARPSAQGQEMTRMDIAMVREN